MTTTLNTRPITIAWPNIKRMLNDRGYVTDALNATIDSNYVYKNMLKKPLSLIFQHNAKDKNILVSFMVDEKVGINIVRDLIQTMKNKAVTQCILFTIRGVTSPTMKEIEKQYPKLKIEVKKYIDFAFCILDHKTQEAHFVVPDKEKRDICKILQTKLELFPQISINDPLVQYYGLDKGDMLCVLSHIGSQEESPYYKVVVNT